MPRKYRRRGWLFEQEEDLGLTVDAAATEEGDPGEEPAGQDLDTDTVEMELQGLIDAIAPESGLEISVEGEPEEDAPETGDDDDDDDLDLEEVYAMVREMEKDEMKHKGKDEMQKMREADKDEAYHEADKDELKKKDEMKKMKEADKDEKDDDETVMEISESMLRREIARLRRSRRQSPRRRLGESRLQRRRRLLREGDAEEMASQFGGGEAGDEMFVDVDEDTLLNALAEELGEVPDASGDAKSAAPSFGGGEAIAERKLNRILRKQLAESKRREQAAKNELKKMNLFNAKLLYVNKLMQNRNLTSKQQRAIVEAIDNAKTLNETKLLYKSLTETLNKRSKNSLNESRARTLGSSSKSLRSGSAPANDGHIDRWATLAGINSKK